MCICLVIIIVKRKILSFESDSHLLSYDCRYKYDDEKKEYEEVVSEVATGEV